MLPNVDVYSESKGTILKDLTSSYKAGKVLVLNNQVWFSVETLIYGNIDAPTLFLRMITILSDMCNEYRRNQNE